MPLNSACLKAIILPSRFGPNGKLYATGGEDSYGIFYDLVEVYVNGESRGLYIQQEKIDESFLRKNKLMPTNIYKGENHATEFYIGLNRNLFNNPKNVLL